MQLVRVVVLVVARGLARRRAAGSTGRSRAGSGASGEVVVMVRTGRRRASMHGAVVLSKLARTRVATARCGTASRSPIKRLVIVMVMVVVFVCVLRRGRAVVVRAGIVLVCRCLK